MTEAGFATILDVDLDLAAADTEPCMIKECGSEAVMHGIITTPCGCAQPLCLYDWDRNVKQWNWQPGDDIWCYLCHPHTRDNMGKFIRWEKIKR